VAKRRQRDRPPREPSGLPDEKLLVDIVKAGGKLLRLARAQVSTIGPITDDSRWGAPFPLRFELQFALLILGALDAYDVATGTLRARASQQAFGTMRFQVETLVLMRWLMDSTDERERQVRAYRILCQQISRWGRLLMADAGKDPGALEVVHAIRQWGSHLRDLAKQDDIDLDVRLPKRDQLFEKYGQRSGGYPTFSMLSEMGSHPSAAGNILFSLRPDSRTINYTLEGAFVDRAFWCSAAIVHLWETLEVAIGFLGWTDWHESQARPAYERALPLMNEALKRRQASHELAEQAASRDQTRQAGTS
jgi:hypothetical protein